MSLDELDQMLLHCIHSDDSVISEEAKSAVDYTDLVKQGQLSKQEYAELMKDIQRTISIHQSMSDMQSKEVLNTALTGLINIATML
jgi:polyhydroxyalkanoate synthesis regulator phasin